MFNIQDLTPTARSVTYTATDAAGNTATATQSVTVTAVTSVPALPLFGGGSAAITVPAGSTLFNVSADPVVVGPAGFSFPVGSISYSVTSPVGGSITTSISFSAPLPSSFVLLKTDGVTYQSIPQALWTVTGPNSVAITLTDGGPFDLDGMANGVIVDPIVVAVDTLPPVITAPADVTASSGDNLPVAVTLGVATATDAVDGGVAVTSDAPATFPVGVTTVTYSATDAAGNTATATQLVTVNLVDVTAPVVTAPAAVTAEATGVSTTVVLGTATATDVVDGVLTTTNDAPASFPVGITTVTYTATDAAGNVGTATQLVTVTDTTPPIITAPVAVTADSINGANVTVALGTATATDLFNVTITNDAPALFPVGVTTVIWTATDANGNSATATQLVTVNLIDTVAPVITVPANVYTSTSTSQATVSIGTATATDNVDGIVAVTNDAPATYPIGVTTVTWTASDAAGNTATATQNIYVSYSSTVGGGSGGTTTPPPAGGGATVTSEAVYWHHNDHLGTPQALTDINGTKVWEMSQTPFGVATVNEDVDGDGIAVANNFRFPGQYYDAETGLNYNYFRTFDPALGRYTQSDPIGLYAGMNTYAYVWGDPVGWVDFYGLGGTRNGPTMAPRSPFADGEARNLIQRIQEINPNYTYSSVGAPSSPGEIRYNEVDVRHLERELNKVSKQWCENNGIRPPNMTPQGGGRRAAFREAKRNAGIPVGQQPVNVRQNVDRRGKPQPGLIYEFEISTSGGGTKIVRIRDDAKGHYFGPSNPQNRGSHFNDPFGNHYDY